MFCVVCGKNEVFIDSQCKECYFKNHTVVQIPDKITVMHCKFCNAVQIGKGWYNDISLDKIVISNLKLDKGSKIDSISIKMVSGNEYQAIYNVTLNIYVSTDFDNATVVIDKDITVKNNYSVCVKCSRLRGGYYEDIVQIRNFDEIITNEIISMINPEQISKEIYLKNGVDIYIIDKHFTKRFISNISRLKSKYKFEVTTSRKLYGKKEGVDVYRTTYLLRHLI
ncbi:MAG: NMD3-related protein [Thermoplasmata archaeon]